MRTVGADTAVTIPAELAAKILRYFHVETWPVGTVARPLGLHRGTVDRMRSQAGRPKLERLHRASLRDPFLPFVRATLERYPTRCASRLSTMVRERGYRGGADRFRRLLLR